MGQTYAQYVDVAVPTIHFRHDGIANILWLDGHVSHRTMDWSRKPTVPGELNPGRVQIGWFGPQDNSLFDYW